MPSREPRTITVRRTERLSPHFLRIVFELDGAEFEVGEFSDHYVKLKLPQPGEPAAPLRTRTYTVRDWDPEEHLLTIDFVVHGDVGVAGPWAEAARVGDTALMVGPGGGYAPDPEAAWHLMVGDAAVLPAIAVSLARVPAGRPVQVFLQVDPEDRIALDSPGDLTVTWVAPGEGALLAAVEALDFTSGEVCAFVHGEAEMVRAVRRHLVVDRGLPAAGLSATGYWKRSRSDEQWREDKPEWKRQVEADAAAVAGSAGSLSE